jgi:hypothetical protein
MGDFGDFFSAVDGLGEDLVDAGIVVGAGVATTIAWNIGVNEGLAQLRKLVPTLPTWVDNYVVPGVAIVGGVTAGTMLGKRAPRLSRGVSYGLVYAGVRQLLRQLAAGSFIANGLGDMSDSYGVNATLLGDGNLYDKYLGSAPMTIESGGGNMSGLSAASITVEQVNNPMNGFGSAPFTVESNLQGTGDIASFFQ